jgi:hypothetical protein
MRRDTKQNTQDGRGQKHLEKKRKPEKKVENWKSQSKNEKRAVHVLHYLLQRNQNTHGCREVPSPLALLQNMVSEYTLVEPNRGLFRSQSLQPSGYKSLLSLTLFSDLLPNNPQAQNSTDPLASLSIPKY